MLREPYSKKKDLWERECRKLQMKRESTKPCCIIVLKISSIFFEAVFMNAFIQLAPQINAIFNSEETVFEKIMQFTHSYISFVITNPFSSPFIIQEMNSNPGFDKTFLKNKNIPNPSLLIEQIKKEIEEGIIKPVDPKQLVLDIFAMTFFPFAAQMMVKGILHINDLEFNKMMEKRKTIIAEQIINSIKK